MERQLTITELRAVFTKDYDTFGKMDPFLQFIVGKQSFRTQTALKGGKQPKWNNTIVIKFFQQENTLIIKGWEQDTTSNDFMGQGKIEIKSLKANGDLQVKIIEDNNNQSGTIYGKYTLKNLAPVPLLTVRNIKCDFYRDNEFVIKTKPFFSINTNGSVQATAHKQKGDSRILSWDETLRIKIKDGEKITLNLQDKSDQNNKIFSYDAFPKQFKTISGKKKFNVIDKNFYPLAVLQFDYETQNFVNKDESTKNQEAAKKENNQLNKITIESIKGNLNKEANDLFFKIIVGCNFFKTTMLDKAKKDFDLNVGSSLYAQKNENKIVFGAFNKESIGGDTFYGSGDIWLDNIAQGKNTVKLQDRRGKHFGDIIVNLNSKNVVSKQLVLTDMKIKVALSADFIGDSDMYVVGTIGGWKSRTQTFSGKQTVFTKNLKFKYSQEKQILFKIMDEDITKDEVIYQIKANLQDFNETGQMSLPLVPEKYKNDKSKHGELTFKFKINNGISKAKQVAPAKKQQQPIVKKQEPKKEQPKKQEQKKQQQQKKIQQKKQEELKKPIISQKNIVQQNKNNSNLNKSHSIDKSRTQNSKNAIKLPSIIDPKNYGDKIFDKKSASTLQKSIVVYSMPKANRFGNGPKYTGQPTYFMDTCFKNNNGKGAGIGFGTKRQFPQWLERNMKQNPAPGAYLDLSKTSDQHKAKGPTFGIPHKYYEKVTIPKQALPIKRQQRKSPQRIYMRKI